MVEQQGDRKPDRLLWLALADSAPIADAQAGKWRRMKGAATCPKSSLSQVTVREL